MRPITTFAFAALLVVAGAGSGNAGPITIADSFDDASLDASKWVAFTFVSGPASATVVESSGLVEGNVTVPTSGGTIGGWSSLRSLHDYNDGLIWTINFEWSAVDTSPAPRHVNYHFIQITDGIYNEAVVPTDGGSWSPEFSTGEESAPNPNVDNTTADGTHHLYFSNDVQVGPVAWSILIDPSMSSATLYDAPDLSGAVLGSRTLDPGDSWYVRWATATGTSAGFPAKDISFELNDFTATAVPEPSSLALLAVGTISLCGYSWRRKRRAAAPESR